jgi:hypothetical protein
MIISQKVLFEAVEFKHKKNPKSMTFSNFFYIYLKIWMFEFNFNPLLPNLKLKTLPQKSPKNLSLLFKEPFRS